MKTKQEITILLRKFLNLEKKGFSYFSNTIDQDGSYYVKELFDAKHILYFNLMKRNFLYGVGGWIYINPVEDLLQPLLVKYDFLKDVNRTERTLLPPYITLEKDIIILNQAQETPLDNETDIVKVSELLLTYIEGVFMPLWSMYSNLKTVNEKIIDKIPDAQITNYIPSYASFKKLIIMKLCNNSKYEEYKNWLYNGLRKRYEEGKNRNYYLLLQELIDILEAANYENNVR